MTRKPRMDVRILIYQTWPISCGFVVFLRVLNFIVIGFVPITLLESNTYNHGFLSFTVIKKSDCVNFKSTVQIPESSNFQILWQADHFWSGIIYGTIWESFPVLGSFTVQSGIHLRYGDHLRAGIICGPDN